MQEDVNLIGDQKMKLLKSGSRREHRRACDLKTGEVFKGRQLSSADIGLCVSRI